VRHHLSGLNSSPYKGLPLYMGLALISMSLSATGKCGLLARVAKI